MARAKKFQLSKVLRFSCIIRSLNPGLSKIKTFKQIFVNFWLCFRMVAMLLLIFDSYCQVAKPLKVLCFLRVLSKIDRIPLCSDTKIRQTVIFSSVLLKIVLFFSSFVLDCVHNRILQYFSKFQRVDF